MNRATAMRTLQLLFWGLVCALLLALASSLSLSLVQAADVRHAHASPAAQAGPWVADPALQAGMQRVEQALQQAHAQLQPLALAGRLQQEVERMLAECRLEPQADAVLHGLLHRLLEQAEALRQGGEGAPILAQLDAVMVDYRHSFKSSQEGPGHAH